MYCYTDNNTGIILNRPIFGKRQTSNSLDVPIQMNATKLAPCIFLLSFGLILIEIWYGKSGRALHSSWPNLKSEVLDILLLGIEEESGTLYATAIRYRLEGIEILPDESPVPDAGELRERIIIKVGECLQEHLRIMEVLQGKKV